MDPAAKIFLLSGLVQLLFGVALGWPVALFHTGLSRVGPIRNMRRLLQCHIDNLMMGPIQLVLGVVLLLAAPGLEWWAAGLLALGSWTNAQMFLIQSTLATQTAVPRWLMTLSILSFIVVTAGYALFALHALPLLWAA